MPTPALGSAAAVSLRTVALAVPVLLAGVFVAHAQDLRIVVEKGRPAFGTSANFSGFDYTNAGIDSVGNVAFGAGVETLGSFGNLYGLWTIEAGDTTLLALDEQTIRLINRTSLRYDGSFGFEADQYPLPPTDPIPSLVLTEGAAGAPVVPYTGVPGVPGATFFKVGSFAGGSFAQSGSYLAFFGQLYDDRDLEINSSNRTGIWTGPRFGLGLAARAGSVMPGAPTAQGEIKFKTFGRVVVSQNGTAAFIGNGSNDASTASFVGVYKSQGGAAATLVAEGSYSNVTVNGNGTLSYTDPANIYINDGAPVVVGATTDFGTLYATVLLENDSLLVLADRLSDGRTAIFRQTPTGFDEVVSESDTAVGWPFATSFSSIDLVSANNAGQVVFRAFPTLGQAGWWRVEPDGSVSLLVKKFDSVVVGADEQGNPVSRTLQTLTGFDPNPFTADPKFDGTGADGYPTYFNDLGQLLLIVDHTTDAGSFDFVNALMMVEPAGIVVNSTADAADVAHGDGECNTGNLNADGKKECTLRAAIQEANALAGRDAITFDIPTGDDGYDEATGRYTIRPASALPAVAEPAAIDGSAPGGGAPKTTPPEACPIIVVSGANAGGGTNGLQLSAGQTDVSAVSFVSFGGFGVVITSNDNTIVESCVGTDDGSRALPNAGGGILIDGSAAEASANFVGTTGPSNIISGNGTAGVVLRGSQAFFNTIYGNTIGADITGLLPLPNGGPGILVDNEATDNTIGDRLGDNGNRIAFNTGAGVRIIDGTGNIVVRNRIFANGGLGIDLGPEGATLNDEGSDADEGANGLQNFPTILRRRVDGGQTTVVGYLDSAAESEFDLEFFVTKAADGSGFGEADSSLGIRSVTTDSSGRADFSFAFAGIQRRVVGTATDASDNTSEISKAPLLINDDGDTPDADIADSICSTGGEVDGEPECTLRAALQQANAIAGEDYIGVDIPGTAPFFVNVASPLPIISDPIILDGTTQTSYDPELPTLSVTGPASNASGLHIVARDATVRGIALNAFDAHGIEFSGAGTLTLSYVQANRNETDGIRSLGHVRGEHTLETEAAVISALANGARGVNVEGGKRLEVAGLTRTNGNGKSLSSQECSGADHAGIRGTGVSSLGSVEAMDNCGYGLTFDHPATIEGDVLVSQTDGIGMYVNGHLTVTGGVVRIEDSALEGVWANFDINISGTNDNQADGAPSNVNQIADPVIRVVGSGRAALESDGGSITLVGESLFERNGSARQEFDCLYNRRGILTADHGSVTTEKVTIRNNCGSGIIAEFDIDLNGDVTITDNVGFLGIWGLRNITLNGTAHDISRNGESAIWSARFSRFPSDGSIKVTGSLKVHDNGTHVAAGTCNTSSRNDRESAIMTEGLIELDDVDIAGNCYNGLFSLRSIAIEGETRIVDNTGAGVVAGGRGLFITGTRHVISRNGHDGISMFHRDGRRPPTIVKGTLVLDDNNRYFRQNDDDHCKPGHASGSAGYAGPQVPLIVDELIASDNCGAGVNAFQLRVHGRIQANGNTGDGVLARAVRLNTGDICRNGGYGVRALGGPAEIGSVRVCENELGGVAQPAAGTLASKRSGAARTSTTGSAIAETSITGASIVDNMGPGIHADVLPMTVTNSNVHGNVGGGVTNGSSTGMIDALANWWGDASGPGGAGPGSGDAAGANVVFSNWLTTPVGLVTRVSDDTLFVSPGDTTEVHVSFRNWVSADDIVDIAVSDDAGWSVGPTDYLAVQLNDSLVATMTRMIVVPPGAAVGQSATVRFEATSQTDFGQSSADSVIVLTYQPAISSIGVAPDSAHTSFGGIRSFAAFGFDQLGKQVDVAVDWTATGGVIDAAGTYTAGDIAGDYSVTARERITGLEASAFVKVSQTVAIEDDPEVQEVDVVDELNPIYPNPFSDRATVPFTVAETGHTRLVVYDVVGRRVLTVIDETMPPGRYETSLDATQLPVGLYFVVLRIGGFTQTQKIVVVR